MIGRDVERLAGGDERLAVLRETLFERGGRAVAMVNRLREDLPLVEIARAAANLAAIDRQAMRERMPPQPCAI
jgi:hypothetical protein